MLRVFSRDETMSINEFFTAYKNLSYRNENHIFLESGRGGRYSICGLQPIAVLEGYSDYLSVMDQKGNVETIKGNPLEGVKSWMRNWKVTYDELIPDFQGGAIGFISYDYARKIEKLPSIALNDLETPLLYFLVFDEFAIFDHFEQKVWFMKIGKQEDEESCMRRIELFRTEFNQALIKEEKPMTTQYSQVNKDLQVSMTEVEFKSAVEKVRNYIARGDLFQVNLSVRQSKPLIAHPLEVYSELRQLNPSPYMSYLNTPSFQIVSGSPELLVKKKGKAVSTRPIAGTRSRGKNAAEDDRLARELIENEKERAEHVMLVDLERNDLGRVCEYGTVEVNEFMVIEKYSHVMHIVSNVQGEIADAFDEYDVINATFPGGTITGAPKVRTMEIIEELEPVRRGLYTGSIGWISFQGDLELNIVIRTMLAQDGLAHVQAGAGVVIDSVPKNEYKESLKKAAAVWKAKEIADEKVLNIGDQK